MQHLLLQFLILLLQLVSLLPGGNELIGDNLQLVFGVDQFLLQLALIALILLGLAAEGHVLICAGAAQLAESGLGLVAHVAEDVGGGAGGGGRAERGAVVVGVGRRVG